MADAKQFNGYFYEILKSMEELARDLVNEKEKDELKVLDKLSSAIQKMDQTAIFEDNMIDFVSDLDGKEQSILFHKIVTPYYEMTCDVLDNEEAEGEAAVNNWSRNICSNIIVELLNDYLEYDYFEESEVIEKIELD